MDIYPLSYKYFFLKKKHLWVGLKGAGPEDTAHFQGLGFSVQERGGVEGTFIFKSLFNKWYGILVSLFFSFQ